MKKKKNITEMVHFVQKQLANGVKPFMLIPFLDVGISFPAIYWKLIADFKSISNISTKMVILIIISQGRYEIW